MPVEAGQNVLLYVGDGGATPISGTIYSVNETAGVYTIERSSGDFIATLPGVAAGDLLHVAGFTTNGALLHGVITAAVALSITIKKPVDADGNPKVLVDEAAGATITITLEKLTKIGGQDDGQLANALTAFDTSTKDTGIWGTSLSDTLKQTLTVNGKANWPDTKGVTALLTAFSAGTLPERWFKFVYRSSGDYWLGEYAITSLNVGGAKGGPTTYSMTIENKLRPQLIPPA